MGIDVIYTDSVGSITAIELYKGTTKVQELTTLTDRSFTGLFSDNEYEIRVTYTYNLSDDTGGKTLTETKGFTTRAKAAPTTAIVDVVSTHDSVTFDVDVTDADNVCSITAIELYSGLVKIDELNDLTQREFRGLNSYTSYTIKVVYEYDLNDGNDLQVSTAFYNLLTLAIISVDSACALNTSSLRIGDTLTLQAILFNPGNVSITRVRVNGIYYSPLPISSKTNLMVDIYIDESYTGGDTLFVFEELSYGTSDALSSIDIFDDNTVQHFINGEFDVLGLTVVDSSYNEVEYIISGNNYFYILYLW